MTKIIYNYNFKGGIGKSTLSIIEAYQLARRNKKVLFIDLDPQSNATDMLQTTYHEVKPRESLLNCLLKGDLKPAICPLTNYLDILPSDWSMSLFNQKIEKLESKTRSIVLKEELKEIKNNYDYIFIDTPPSLSSTTNNALLASDYVTVIIQTQKASYLSAIQTVAYYEQMRKDYSANYKFLGAILYLFATGAGVDNEIETKSHDFFGDSLFANKIYHRERVKRWAAQGISANAKDAWDKRTHSMYELVTNEMLEKMGDI